jgi:hypothetical protein
MTAIAYVRFCSKIVGWPTNVKNKGNSSTLLFPDFSRLPTTPNVADSVTDAESDALCSPFQQPRIPQPLFPQPQVHKPLFADEPVVVRLRHLQ